MISIATVSRMSINVLLISARGLAVLVLLFPDHGSRARAGYFVHSRLFSFSAGSLLPARLLLQNPCFRWPRERQQKGAVFGGLHIMRNAPIQREQVTGREVHHPVWQVKPDMAAQRVHRDPACRRVLMHARICLHRDQHNAEICVLYKRPRTPPRGVQPRFITVQLVEFSG